MDITHTLQLLANASAGITTVQTTAPAQPAQNVVTVQGAAGSMGQAFIQGKLLEKTAQWFWTNDRRVMGLNLALRGVEWAHGLFLFPLVLGKM